MAPSRTNRVRGTTLIEILVTIVIFLIGILAVLQIFPKGFQILVYGRNQSVASALARDEVERLESRASELPAMIVSASRDANGNLFVNPATNPNSLGPIASAIDQFGSVFNYDGSYLPLDYNTIDGTLDQGSNIYPQNQVSADDNWMRFSGPNTMRHVVGESRIVPAPRLVGGSTAMYGGLIVLNFGPVDFYKNPNNSTNSINVYGNDLNPYYVPANASAFSGTLGTGTVISSVQHTDDEYYIVSPQTNAITLALPVGPSTLLNGTANAANNRIYEISLSAYILVNSKYVRRDYTGLTVSVPNGTPDVNGILPLYEESLSSLIPSLGSVDLSTLRVRRGFLQVPSGANWQAYEPYTCELVNPQLGVILFSPFAFGVTINGPSGPQPLVARIDYDVYDWRILREDFRFPANQIAQHVLAVGNIRVGGQAEFDGSQNTVNGVPANVILPLEGPNSQTYIASNTGLSDNFVLVDLDTGGVYLQKYNLANAPAQPLDTYITINKSNGLITVKDLEPGTTGTQANLLLPDGTIMQNVTIDNRAVRALYQPKSQFAVQVFKPASTYTQSPTPPGAGQFAIGADINGAATRIYFPVTDLGRKVSAGVINYRRQGDTSPRQMFDQDFVIAFPSVPDGVGLPCIDVANVDYLATTLDVSIDAHSFGYAVSGVKGASVAVRALWNPASFQLGTDASNDSKGNITKAGLWGQNWRQALNETYLEQGDLIP
jgi:Tfp pilus assembly protein FimT